VILKARNAVTVALTIDLWAGAFCFQLHRKKPVVGKVMAILPIMPLKKYIFGVFAMVTHFMGCRFRLND